MPKLLLFIALLTVVILLELERLYDRFLLSPPLTGQTERLTGSGDELDCCEEYSKTRGLNTTGSCFVELETTARRDLSMELGLVT